MDSTTFGLVQHIAEQTRNWAEEKAYLARYNEEDLCGWCAIASAELFKRLTLKGIDAEIHLQDEDAYCHCFVVVNDHVVDVTATQFGNYADNRIIIKHVKEAEVNEYHRSTKVFKSAKALRTYQKKTHWPSNQIAFA